LDQGLLTTTEFQPAHLELTDSGLSYGDGSYHHIVFCQGNRVLSNPYFKFLEVYPMKGEYLICKIPGLEQAAAMDYLAATEARMGLPTVDPFRQGAGRLVDALA
jgi:hypothetical protein